MSPATSPVNSPAKSSATSAATENAAPSLVSGGGATAARSKDKPAGGAPSAPVSASPQLVEKAVNTAKPEQGKTSLLKLMSQWLKDNFSGKSGDTSLKDALEEVLEEHEEESAALAPEERVLLRNMLSFGELTVSDIMIPRTDILAVEAESTLDELKRTFLEQGHTRMPVYHDNLDHVRGFVHLKDLVPMLCGDRPFELSAITREILFVPPSMKIVDLLLKMRVSGTHMAIVVDEFGGTDGLVTMEDLVEEIVGEIQDEHDDFTPSTMIRTVSEQVIEADARVRIEELQALIALPLASEDDVEAFDTLGGLLFFHLGRIPARGETVTLPNGMKMDILDADPRRIKRVRVHLPEPGIHTPLADA